MFISHKIRDKAIQQEHRAECLSNEKKPKISALNAKLLIDILSWVKINKFTCETIPENLSPMEIEATKVYLSLFELCFNSRIQRLN